VRVNGTPQGRAALTNHGLRGNMESPRFAARIAQVAELADALASGASSRKGVEVRVLSWAPYFLPLTEHTRGLITTAYDGVAPRDGSASKELRYAGLSASVREEGYRL
jgi:hypothetical protein